MTHAEADQAQKRSQNGFSNAPEIALVYVGLDDMDQATISLEKPMRSALARGSSCGQPSTRCCPTRDSRISGVASDLVDELPGIRSRRPIHEPSGRASLFKKSPNRRNSQKTRPERLVGFKGIRNFHDQLNRV